MDTQQTNQKSSRLSGKSTQQVMALLTKLQRESQFFVQMLSRIDTIKLIGETDYSSPSSSFIEQWLRKNEEGLREFSHRDAHSMACEAWSNLGQQNKEKYIKKPRKQTKLDNEQHEGIPESLRLQRELENICQEFRIPSIEL